MGVCLVVILRIKMIPSFMVYLENFSLASFFLKVVVT